MEDELSCINVVTGGVRILKEGTKKSQEVNDVGNTYVFGQHVDNMDIYCEGGPSECLISVGPNSLLEEVTVGSPNLKSSK